MKNFKMKNLLIIRKNLKKKKPVFLRQDALIKKKLSKKWRKPRGMHSKLREGRKGHPKKPSSGYRSPKAVRNLTKEGFKQLLIYNPDGLQKMNKETQTATLAKSVGLKKKIKILEKAKSLGFKLSNIKDIDATLKEIEEKLIKKKETKTKRFKEKVKKETEKIEEVKEKPKEEIKEIKPEEEKLEKEKILKKEQPMKRPLPSTERKQRLEKVRTKIIGEK